MSTQVSVRPQFIRLKQVLVATTLSRSTIYALIKKTKFPKQIALGTRSVGWLSVEVDGWIDQQISLSRGASND